MRLLRWVGDPAIWSDRLMIKNLMQETLPLPVVAALQEYDRNQRICAVPGQSELSLGPAHGFTQTYVFGPHQFAVWMQDEDAARLFANEWDRWQFLDITDAPETEERPPLTGQQWQALLASFRKLTPQRRLKAEYR